MLRHIPLKMPSFNFGDFSNIPAKHLSMKLPDLVAKTGSVLIRKVLTFQQSYSFISQFAEYRNLFLTWAHLKNYPGAVEVSNIVNPSTKKTGWFKDKELGWHTNGIFMEEPETCVALFCSIPSYEGGETEIINMRRVYDDLDEKDKQSLKNVYVIYENATNKTGFYDFDDFEANEFIKHSYRHATDKDKVQYSNAHYTIKKLVYKHPVDGKYGLYFPFTMFKAIQNYSGDRSESLYYNLKTKCLKKKYRTVVKWEKNDFLLIDQIHTLHRRRVFRGDRQLFRICFDWKTQNATSSV